MSVETGFCAWSFKYAEDSPYKDCFIERFKFLIDHFGLRFPNEHQYPWETIRKYSMEPQALTEEEWRITGYPFPQKKREALIMLITGETEFSKEHTEWLEDLYGDFFDLKGIPRHKVEVSDCYKLAA